MRILILTQIVLFPPDSGPKVKTYNGPRYLAQRHEVHLLSFARDPAEEKRWRNRLSDTARRWQSFRCASRPRTTLRSLWAAW